MIAQTRPRLRAVEIKRLHHQGRWYFHFHDQLSLAGSDLLVPMELAPALALFDGEHDLAMIRARALLQGGLSLSPGDVIDLVRQLDGALLLDGDQSEQAKRIALEAYRSAPFRPPVLAGRAYPADPSELKSHLGSFDACAGNSPLPPESVAGILSPHIDYARGGAVYARGWKQAREAARLAELVIVLGTDHHGSAGSITLTSQRYATPWGAFEAATDLEQALAEALGADAYAEELHHRTEHSVELASVFLHHVRDGAPMQMLPVLCGHPGPYLLCRVSGADPKIDAAIGVLREAVQHGAFIVVAGDLAHVGPAFGDPRAFLEPERAAVRAADMALVEACSRGADAMLAEAAREDNRYRVCGLSALALALAIMPAVRLDIADYAQCPADEAATSFVSVAAGSFVRQ
jgi:MEMO1 family protein